MQREDVGFSQQLFEINFACAQLALRFRSGFCIGVDNLHIKGFGSSRNRLANPAEAKDTQRLAADLVTAQQVRIQNLKTTRS